MREDKKDAFFIGHMQDLAERSFRQGFPLFSDFLTTSQLQVLSGMLHTWDGVKVSFWGGSYDCEYVMAGFFPAGYPECESSYFPIDILHITTSQNGDKTLTHRDFLGAIMNLGIERSKIGDLRIAEGDAYVCCHRDFSIYIIENLSFVGHESVTCHRIEEEHAKLPGRQYEEYTRSIASPRLDNVISAATGVSRTKAAQFIRQGLVIINHKECSSVSFHCRDDSLITVRGFGKFRIMIPENSYTKKGKQKIIIYKYI